MRKSLAFRIASVALGVLLSTCNNPQTITICKQTQPAGGTGFPFTASSGSQHLPLPPFTLNDTQCHATPIAAGQDHFNTFTENVPAGWILTSISCNATTSAVSIIGGNPNPAFQLGDNAVAIDINEPLVVCTFVNRQAPPCCAFSADLSTGQGSAATDPVWTVNGGPAFITPPVSAWTTTLTGARWIQPVAAPLPSSSVPQGLYRYRVSFTVPPCGMGHAELNGSFAADNNASVMLDNNPIAGATCTNCFNTAAVPFSVPNVTVGPHVLEIDVTNLGGYSGLLVSAQVRRVCP